jgi:hypothetical protein
MNEEFKNTWTDRKQAGDGQVRQGTKLLVDLFVSADRTGHNMSEAVFGKRMSVCNEKPPMCSDMAHSVISLVGLYKMVVTYCRTRD